MQKTALDQYFKKVHSVVACMLSSFLLRDRSGAYIDTLASAIVYGGMPSNLHRSDIDAWIDRLSERKAASVDEQVVFDGAIAALTRVRRLLGDAGKQALPSSEVAQAPTIPVQTRSRYFGMGLAAAAVQRLEIAGGPQTPREIWDALSAEGFVSNHNDPVHATTTAIKKWAAANKGDLILVGHGKWDLRKRYSPERIAEIERDLPGMATRDHADHLERTKRGMQAAKDRGVAFGSKSKITAAVVISLREKLKAGVLLRDACASVGISTMTYYKWRRRMEVWKENEPWPPPEPPIDEQEMNRKKPDLRIVS